MKKVIESLRKVIVEIILDVVPVIYKFLEFLYVLYPVWLTVILTMYQIELCTSREEIYASILISVCLFALYLVARRGHKKYVSMRRRANMAGKNKFVHYDVFGNPSIDTSDLPEIIEFLERYEKGEII